MLYLNATKVLNFNEVISRPGTFKVIITKICVTYIDKGSFNG